MKKTIFYFLALLFLASCKDEVIDPPAPVADQLKMTMQPTFGSSDLVLDQTYTTDEGYLVQFTDLKCYLTDVASSATTLSSSALFDYRGKGTSLFTKPGNPANFTSLTANLGVPASKNHADPTSFASTDPLYITIANDMHWGWNPGYIFIKVEAKVDTIPNGIDNFDHYIVFHVGGEPYLQNLQLNSIAWVAEGNGIFSRKLKLDMQKFLNNGTESIDLKTEHSSHTAAGQEALSLKVIEHFNQAISLY
jgi:hypothetical protein